MRNYPLPAPTQQENVYTGNDSTTLHHLLAMSLHMVPFPSAIERPYSNYQRLARYKEQDKREQKKAREGEKRKGAEEKK